MAHDRLTEVKRLFAGACTLEGPHRESWLRRECGGDDAILEAVQSLLAFDAPEGDPLEQAPLLDMAAFDQFPLPGGGGYLPQISGYSVHERVGEGGQSVVYRATMQSTGRTVAVKLLMWGRFATAEQRERFSREVNALAKLQHPNIVSVLDCGETADGCPFLVTDYVAGRQIDEFVFAKVANHSGFGAEEIVRLFLRVVAAVGAASKHDVVHRDIKPSNILIDEYNEPHLLDFGLAKALGGEAQRRGFADVTKAGQFAGTIAWAAPEQFDSTVGQIGPWTDVYSLGCLLYHLLSSGESPYSPLSSRGIPNAAPRSDPIPLRQAVASGRDRDAESDHRSQLDAELETIVLKAMQNEPEMRHASAVDLHADLERWLQSRTANSPGVHPSSNDRGWLTWQVGCITLAAVLIAVALGSYGFGPTESSSQAGVANEPPPSSPVEEAAGGAVRLTAAEEPNAPEDASDGALNLDFSQVDDGELPDGWTADEGLLVSNGRLALPSGQKRALLLRSGELSVPGDFELRCRHLVDKHGELKVVLHAEAGGDIEFTLFRVKAQIGANRPVRVGSYGKPREAKLVRRGPTVTLTLPGAENLVAIQRPPATITGVSVSFSADRIGPGVAELHTLRLRHLRD